MPAWKEMTPTATRHFHATLWISLQIKNMSDEKLQVGLALSLLPQISLILYPPHIIIFSRQILILVQLAPTIAVAGIDTNNGLMCGHSYASFMASAADLTSWICRWATDEGQQGPMVQDITHKLWKATTATPARFVLSQLGPTGDCFIGGERLFHLQ